MSKLTSLMYPLYHKDRIAGLSQIFEKLLPFCFFAQKRKKMFSSAQETFNEHLLTLLQSPCGPLRCTMKKTVSNAELKLRTYIFMEIRLHAQHLRTFQLRAVTTKIKTHETKQKSTKVAPNIKPLAAST